MIKYKTFIITREEINQYPCRLLGTQTDIIIDRIIIEKLIELEKVSKDKINVFARISSVNYNKNLYKIDIRYEVIE